MASPFDPLKVDFSNFYKFVSSVGLVLLASSVVLPWFVLRAAAPETGSDAAATKVVHVALGARADQYSFIVHVYPWVSIGLFCGGVALLAYGLVQWRSRQKAHDADEDESHRQRKLLGKTVDTTAEEKEAKLDEEATEETAEPERDTSKAEQPRDDASSSSEKLPSTVPPRSTSPDRWALRRESIKRAEEVVSSLIRYGFEDTHSIERLVRVPVPQSPEVTPALDIVARSQSTSWTSFAMDVRLMPVLRGQVVPREIARTMLHLAIAARGVPEGTIPRSRVGRPRKARAVAVSVLVIPTEAEDDERLLERVRSDTRTTNSVLRRQVGVLVVREADLDKLTPEQVWSAAVRVMETPEDLVILR